MKCCLNKHLESNQELGLVEHGYNHSMEETKTDGCVQEQPGRRHHGLFTFVLNTNTKQNRQGTSLKKILQYSPELLWSTYLDFSVHLSYSSTDLLAVEQSLAGERKQKLLRTDCVPEMSQLQLPTALTPCISWFVTWKCRTGAIWTGRNMCSS